MHGHGHGDPTMSQTPSTARTRLAHLVATFAYVGHARPAPGTWGSLAALPAGWLIYTLGGWPLLALACVIGFFKGWWATSVYIEGGDDHDPSEVVVDEVIGQWIALLPVAIGASHAGVPITELYPGIVVAFLAFRAFDIWKPGPVGWADRRGDALGVMLDDVIAGGLAAITVGISAGVAHAL